MPPLLVNSVLGRRHSRMMKFGGTIAQSLRNGLKGYWKLDEASGTRFDSTANNNDLLDFSTVQQAAGVVGESAKFENPPNNEYLSITDASQTGLDITQELTIAFWVRADGVQELFSGMVTKSCSATNDISYFVGFSTDGTLPRFVISSDGTGGGATGITGTTALRDNEWDFIVCTYDTVTGAISVNNGTPDTAAFASSIFNGAADFAIGTVNIGAAIRYFNGLIDEVGVWCKVLTAEEITYLYNNGLGATYPFNDPADLGVGEYNTAFDFSFKTGGS